jgi:hypothetical protein
MKKILGLLAFSLLSLGVASASSLPCTISGTAIGGAVGSSTSVTCGGLTFNNFQVINPTGGAAGIVDITEISDSACGSEVCLTFNPNLQSNQDEALLFQVTGGINQIDMSVGGSGASITELACSAPVPTSGNGTGICPTGDLLGSITVDSGETASTTPPCDLPTCQTINPTSPVYIFKNINVETGGLSEFTQTFDPSSGGTTPEPVSMVLLGSGLLGLGLLRRRTRKNKD